MLRLLLIAALLPLLGCQNNRPPHSDILAIYEKTGGIAGLDERLVVRETGILTLADRRAGATRGAEVGPGELAPLRETLGSEAFLSTDRAYRVGRGADLITYTIEGRAGSRAHTVTTMDSAAHPPVIDRAIAELERLLHLARDTGAPRAD